MLYHSFTQLEKRYDNLMEDLSSVNNMPSDGVQQNIDKLNALENLKYATTYLLTQFERLMYVSRANALKNILNDSSVKKALSSSTLTNILVEEKVSELIYYRMLLETLRNIRSSIDVNRSLLSAEKKLSEIDVH